MWWSDLGRPTPLTAEEEASAAAIALARRFNPAMAFSDRDLWPVEVRYTWRDGADLIAETIGPEGDVVRERVAVANADLNQHPWGELPVADEQGRAIRYRVDAPGDDRSRAGRTRWRERWAALVGKQGKKTSEPSHPAVERAFAPTQHAHLFWWNRDQGLLAVQYWFFYPFNEWVNRHEGDWEHVNVILQGPSHLQDPDAFRPVGYRFSFHSLCLDTDRVMRVAGPDPAGDHVVVFVGGRGRLLWWSGTASGASYPLPAFYRRVGSGPIKPDEDTRHVERFLAPQDFQIVMLPEPERLDSRAHPELSWLKLPFYAGQARMRSNPPLIDWLGNGGPVLQPARRLDWHARRNKPPFPGRPLRIRDLALPWALLYAPFAAPAPALADAVTHAPIGS